MRYIIYLFGVMVSFIVTAIFIPPYGHYPATIYFTHLIYFLDYRLLIFTTLICVLALLCTKQTKPFMQSFGFAFGKNKPTKTQCEQSLLAVKTVSSVALLYGALQGAVALITSANILLSDPSVTGNIMTIPLLSLVYSLLICIILFPIQIVLKKQLMSKTK